MFSGCGDSLREDEYRVTVETLIDQQDMKVQRLHLTFKGAKGVQTTETGEQGGGGKTTTWFRSEEPARIQTADVTLSAVQIPVKSEDSLSQHVRTCVQIGESGGHMVRVLQKNESVKDGVRLNVKEGVYQVGEPLEVGQLLDERIELLVATVEQLDAAELNEVATHDASPPLGTAMDAADAQNHDHRE